MSQKPSDRVLAINYALIDAARDEAILDYIRKLGYRYQSLYQGAPEMEDYGPFLVEFDRSSPAALLRAAWAKNWGVYIESESSFEVVRRHLRNFLMIKLPDGRSVYFRFYDPRVLLVFLRNATPEEVDPLFTCVRAWWIENESALLRFTAAGVDGRLSEQDWRNSCG